MKNGVKVLVGLCAVFSLAVRAQFFPIPADVVPYGDNQRSLKGSSVDFRFSDSTKQLLVGLTASASRPAYSFPGIGNNDNGLWRSGTDEISLVTAGQNRLTIGPTGTISFGTNLAPFVPTAGGTMTGGLTVLAGVTSQGFYGPVVGSVTGAASLNVLKAGDTMTGNLTLPITASRALVADGSSSISVSTTTASELAFLSGATANIQNQINNFAAGTGFVLKAGDTMTGILYGTTSRVNNGAVGSPAFSFSSKPSTGFFVTSSGSLRAAVEGAQAIDIATSTGTNRNIGIGADASSSADIPVSIQRDQNSQTIARVTNASAGSSAEAIYSVGSDVGSSTISQKSAAGGSDFVVSSSTASGVDWVASVGNANQQFVVAVGNADRMLVSSAGIASPNLIASRVVVTDGNKILSSSTATSTEVAFLTGLTANVQDQLNAAGAGMFVPLAGGTMSGNLVVNAQIANTATITSGTEFSIAAASGMYAIAGNDMISVGTGYGAANLFLGSTSAVTSGTNNTAAGSTAGNSITTGGNNTLFGTNAGTTITTTSDNSVFGSLAGANISSGSQLTLMGRQAGTNMTTTVRDVVIGYQAANAKNGGDDNTFIGSQAASSISGSGSFRNVFIGRQAGISVATSLDNILVGVSSATNSIARNSIAIGTEAIVTASSSVQIGKGTNATANSLQYNGEITSNRAGSGFSVKEGSNARMGSGTLVAGAVSVPTTAVSVGDAVFYSVTTAGGTQGFLSLSGVTTGVGFGIQSTSGTDTSGIRWMIIKPSP